MTGGTDAADYGERARTYAAEIAHVPQPSLLPELLRPGVRVAELPSGTGHFLHSYAASGARVVLIDACPQMLHAARRQIDILRLGSVETLCCRAQDLTPSIGPVEVAVVPNAALNQLAADTDPTDIFTAAAGILAPGGLLLAQVLLLDAAGTVASCGFYDPAAVHGAWLTDRHLTDEGDRSLARRRRQRRDGDRLHLDFEFTADGETVCTSGVDLRLLTMPDIVTAADNAGLTIVHDTVSHGGFHEILAAPATGSPR